jgi:hypothetical protein
VIAPHLVPHAVDPAVAADLRARLAAAGTELFDLADRGRYRWNGTLRVEPIWEMITGVASAFSGTPLVVAGARWLHLARGDYALVKDDARTRPAETVAEATLDLSERASGEAELIYALPGRGPAIVLPQLPLLLAIVPRPPALTRYDRPLTLRAAGAEVIRLRLWLR